jgi:peptidyl-prolyl cis-trans isomerase A (cyclophilin A)
MEAVTPQPVGMPQQPAPPPPAPLPDAKKGRSARAFVAVAIALIFLAGAGAAFYTGSLQSKQPAPVHKPPVDSTPYPTAWVNLNTSYGDITIGLYGNETPVTTGNFMNLTKTGFYTCTTFHRVVKGFVIQGGGYTLENLAKPVPYPPIKLEINSKLHNLRGTVSMARTSDPDSATTQFFINLVDNSAGKLDPGGYSQEGYAVFGVVVKGMDVVDRIAQAPTGTAQGSSERSLPDVPIIINGATTVPAPAG